MLAIFLSTILPLTASGPDYRVPENATGGPEICFTTQLTSELKENGWSEFRSELSSESHESRYWMKDLEFYSLERASDGRRVVHTRMDEEPLGPGLTQRTRHVTEWTRPGTEWRRRDYEVTQTITRRPGAPTRIVENREGRSLVWDVSTKPAGDVQVSQRSLRNPSALNTEKRRVGNYVEVCRFGLR